MEIYATQRRYQEGRIARVIAMSVLSAQSIRHLCFATNAPPLINPFYEKGIQNGRSFGLSACTYDCRIAHPVVVPVWAPGQGRLVATLEQFALPKNVCGTVLDKSTHARVFVSAMNTHLDPGWSGFLTAEILNFGSEALDLKEGDPLIQVKFEWLDEETDRPYQGKYQNQESGPQGPRWEK